MCNSEFTDAGNNDNFTLNYLKFSKPIARFLNKIICDRHICEELSHDVFLKVFEKKIHLDPQSAKTMNFLLTVAKNMAIDYLRRKKKEQEKFETLYYEKKVSEFERCGDVGDLYLKGEIISTLSDIINSFPEKKREVFIKKNFCNENTTSIARDACVSHYRIRQIDDELHLLIRERLMHFFADDD
jgi:RNA polymerase sigma factor (sigma-70 family)